MEFERKGSRYTRTCQKCNKMFWTDNKKVVYCSRACSKKAAKRTWEAIQNYRQQPHVKKKLAEYKREYRKKLKEKSLASDINAYFTYTHGGRMGAEQIKEQLRKKGSRR